MRFFYFLLLLLLIAPIAIFAYQNQERITLDFLNQTLNARLVLILVAAYVLGMFSGWTVVGMFRRSYRNLTEGPR